MTECGVLYKVELVLGVRMYFSINFRPNIRNVHVKTLFSDTNIALLTWSYLLGNPVHCFTSPGFHNKYNKMNSLNYLWVSGRGLGMWRRNKFIRVTVSL